jgi:D-threo-aldose 1-dehydrogenase
MQTRRIGRTDVLVTDIAFGCTAIGNMYRAATDADAEATLELAWREGIRYFDTAPHYGRGLGDRRLASFLRQMQRESYVLSTKVGRVLTPAAPVSEAEVFVDPLPNAVHFDYSAEGILQSFEQSCQRFGTDHIDIIYVHDLGTFTHGENSAPHMKAFRDSGHAQLMRLKETGRVAAIGLGVNEVEVCLEVMDFAQIDVILLAGRLTLLDRSAEAELVPRCYQAGTSLVLGGIFNSGILATGPVEGAMFNYQPASREVLDRVRALQADADALGVPLATLALQFAHRHQAASSVLLGVAEPALLRSNLDALTAESPRGAERVRGWAVPI